MIVRHLRLIVTLVVFFISTHQAVSQPADTNYDESQVPEYILPKLLVDAEGNTVATTEDWEQRRRPEVLHLFEQHVYGKTPSRRLPIRYEVVESDTNALDGLATRRQVTMYVQGDQLQIQLLLYIPNAASAPVPAFLGLNFYGNQTIHADPKIRINPGWMRANGDIGIVDHRATEKTRGAYAERWQLEKVLRRGYALATLYCGDLDPDTYQHDFTDGLHPLFYEEGQSSPGAHDWGTIGAWAWGLSRSLDYLESDESIDGEQVAVLGHSRLGKTALWAGAQDSRFAFVISNNSGCGGAALYRRCFGERIHHMVKPIGYWFCKHHLTYAKREPQLPIDQHMLIALMAPRPVYVASAQEDDWADPRGEFLAARNASPVYELYQLPTLAQTEFPEVDQPLVSTVSYHVRTGKHDVTEFDWEQYLDAFDRIRHD